MFAGTLTRNFNPKRLRNLLVLFFLVLTIPTAGLIWQAYSQLKWEAFYQYRGMADELTRRIDSDLRGHINTIENRSFTDYAFLVVSGDPAANFLQRSPLSEYPLVQDLPGVIGYFQVGANGEFTTPLLPSDENAAGKLGIADDEYKLRLELAQELQQVLADNQLVRSKVNITLGSESVDTPVASSDLEEAAFEKERIFDNNANYAIMGRQSAADSAIVSETTSTMGQDDAVATGVFRGYIDGTVTGDKTPADKDSIDELAEETRASESLRLMSRVDNEAYSQHH